MTQLYAYVNDAQLQGASDGTPVGVQATKRGELRIQDFWTHMALQGRCYQINAGNIATGVAMANAIQSAKAEMSVDALAGTTIIPASFGVNFDDIATALTVKIRLAAVGVVSSAGTAFVPLPMLQGGNAGVATARVANNAGVTVTAETALITRQLFGYANVNTETPASVTAPAALAGPLASIAAVSWVPRVPYVGKGAACVYVAMGAGTAFPLYFANLVYVELPTANL